MRDVSLLVGGLNEREREDLTTVLPVGVNDAAITSVTTVNTLSNN